MIISRENKDGFVTNEQAEEAIGEVPGVESVKPYRDGLELVLGAATTPMMVLDHLRVQNVEISRFEVATPSLHEIFIKLAGADHE